MSQNLRYAINNQPCQRNASTTEPRGPRGVADPAKRRPHVRWLPHPVVWGDKARIPENAHGKNCHWPCERDMFCVGKNLKQKRQKKFLERRERDHVYIRGSASQAENGRIMTRNDQYSHPTIYASSHAFTVKSDQPSPD